MRDLDDRLLNFAVNTLSFLKTIPFDAENKVVKTQLARSCSSIGANYQESQAGSRKEFSHRIQICLREARETLYWFKIVDKLDLGKKEERKILMKEAREIMLICGSIATNVKKNMKSKEN